MISVIFLVKKDSWKFKKMYQIFLVTNFLNESCVPEENFPTLLEYFENMEGNARKVAIDCAKLAIAVSDDKNLKSLEEEEGNSVAETAIEENILKRAQKVIALLEA